MSKILISNSKHPLAFPLADALRKSGHEVFVNESPIASIEAVRALLRDCGTPDCMILSGYPVLRATLDSGKTEDIVRTINADIMETFFLVKHIGCAMVENGSGSILFLSSIFADKPCGACPSYSISQGAMQMMLKELALFYGNMGLRTNMLKLAPALCEDDIFSSDVVSAAYDIDTKAPTRLRTDVEDVAGIVEFFMSRPARNINGADLRVDGGLLYFYGDRPYKPVKEALLS